MGAKQKKSKSSNFQRGRARLHTPSAPIPAQPPMPSLILYVPPRGLYPLAQHPQPPMDLSSTTYLDSQSDICVPYKSPVTHPGSLPCVSRACPVPSCAALPKDSWIVWFDAMLKWLMLAASSWTTSLTVTSCVSSTHWLSMHTPSFCRYLVTPTRSPGYVTTLEFQRPSVG